MLNRSDKEKIINGINGDIQRSKAAFLTNVVGMTSNDAVALRKSVRDSQGRIFVARNTLFQLAGKGTYCEKMLTGLKGNNALVLAFEEAPAVAKAVYEVSKENEVVVLRAGMLGEQELLEKDVVALAKLPSKAEMLGTLLATFNAPISALARVLNAIREKKEAGGGAVVEAAVAEPATEANNNPEEKSE